MLTPISERRRPREPQTSPFLLSDDSMSSSLPELRSPAALQPLKQNAEASVSWGDAQSGRMHLDVSANGSSRSPGRRSPASPVQKAASPMQRAINHRRHQLNLAFTEQRGKALAFRAVQPWGESEDKDMEPNGRPKSRNGRSMRPSSPARPGSARDVRERKLGTLRRERQQLRLEFLSAMLEHQDCWRGVDGDVFGTRF